MGAFLNGEPLRLAPRPRRLKDAVAAVDLKRLRPSGLMRLGADAPYRSHRSLGCVALEWCWLAAGRFQLYLHGGQRLWDYSAGRLIASEARVASGLYEQIKGPGPLVPAEGLTLETRRAVAAADQALLEDWLEWIEQA